MDLTTLTLEQLKAVAFDLIAAKDATQTNLNIVLGEIQKRNVPPTQPVKEGE